jgi:hypothetical protein
MYPYNTKNIILWSNMENNEEVRDLVEQNKISSKIYKKWGFIWDFETQYIQVLVLLLMFGLMFGVGYFIRLPNFNITFWISEFDSEVVSRFYTKDILDLICINLIFPLFAVWTRNSVNKNYNKYYQVKTVKNFKNIRSNKNSKRNINWGNYIFYFFMAVMIFGNTSHVLANRFSGLLVKLDPSLRETSLFFSIYFWDEYFGHLTIILGLYGMAFTNLYKQIKIPLIEYKISWDKWTQMCLTGMGLGAGISLAMMEGQSNPILFVINIILLIFLVFYILQSKNRIEPNETKWSLKNHPVIIVYILEATFFIIASIVWGLVYGIMDHYPFFYQKGGERLW